jgi:NADH dehydrogenase/NADH:ubiquinone oxidoreductase subunit G
MAEEKEQRDKLQTVGENPGVTNSMLEAMQDKFGKLGAEIKKEMGEWEKALNLTKLDTKKESTELKEALETKLSNMAKAAEESQGSGVSPEFIEAMNEKLGKASDIS